jgi:hypothetical protein
VKRPPLAFALVVVPTLVFVVLHLAGARAHLGILSGTRVDSLVDLVLAVAYALAWFGVVLVAPIVLLASALARLAARIPGVGGWTQSWRSSRRP